MTREPIRILLLEDSPFDVELIRRELTRGGVDARIEHVTNEATLRSALSGDGFDVILADYHLPAFSGMLALEIARHVAPDTPFLFVSGAIGEERAIEALQRGATDYIIKDRISRLPSAVERALAERAEKRLRSEAQERFLLASQASHDVIWDWRVDQSVVWVNDTMRTEWGYTLEGNEVTYEWWLTKIHPSDAEQVRRHLDKAIASREVRWQLGYRFRRADGRYGYVFDRGVILRDESGRAVRVIGAMQDVTVRVETERELEREQRISSMGRLAAMIAHEFNNVLMGIQSFGEVVERRGKEDAVLSKAARHILSAVSRGRDITRDLLGAAKPAEPALESVDLSAWLRDLEAEVRGILPPAVSLAMRTPSTAVVVQCDSRQLHQAVMNLAINARDAVQGKGGALRIALTANGGTASITVADTGSGIDESVLPHIFEPLFTTKKTGTGLGLAIVRQLVAANGGTIAVESSSEGTLFTIDFPISDAEPATTTPPAAGRQERWSHALRRLLIVEDDEDVAAGMQTLLEDEGFDVRCVSRASEVGAAMREFAPDAVILDLTLADGSGLDVYRDIVSAVPDLPVLFASGEAEPAALREHAVGGRVDFLSKPYDIATLMERLQKIA